MAPVALPPIPVATVRVAAVVSAVPVAPVATIATPVPVATSAIAPIPVSTAAVVVPTSIARAPLSGATFSGATVTPAPLTPLAAAPFASGPVRALGVATTARLGGAGRSRSLRRGCRARRLAPESAPISTAVSTTPFAAGSTGPFAGDSVAAGPFTPGLRPEPAVSAGAAALFHALAATATISALLAEGRNGRGGGQNDGQGRHGRLHALHRPSWDARRRPEVPSARTMRRVRVNHP